MFHMSYEDGQKILNLPGVKDALQDLAEHQVLPKAASLAASAGLPEYAADLRVEVGVRPKGRPYARVIADRDDAEKYEHGDTKTARLRILGRAAGVQIWPDVPR